MDHWIIYDPATGEEVGRGYGPQGSGERQVPGGGRRALTVPRAVIRHGIDGATEALREAMVSRVARAAAGDRMASPPARLRRALALEERINAAATAADLLKIDIEAGASGKQEG